MNKYPFSISDYISHTAHLSPMEDLAYRRILELYCLRDGNVPITAVEIANLVRLQDCLPQVEVVLNQFFNQSASGEWRHHQCDLEIEKAHNKSRRRKTAGLASAAARRASKLVQDSGQNRKEQMLNTCSTNVEHLLSNRSTSVGGQELPTDHSASLDPARHAASNALGVVQQDELSTAQRSDLGRASGLNKCSTFVEQMFGKCSIDVDFRGLPTTNSAAQNSARDASPSASEVVQQGEPPTVSAVSSDQSRGSDMLSTFFKRKHTKYPAWAQLPRSSTTNPVSPNPAPDAVPCAPEVVQQAELSTATPVSGNPSYGLNTCSTSVGHMFNKCSTSVEHMFNKCSTGVDQPKLSTAHATASNPAPGAASSALSVAQDGELSTASLARASAHARIPEIYTSYVDTPNGVSVHNLTVVDDKDNLNVGKEIKLSNAGNASTTDANEATTLNVGNANNEGTTEVNKPNTVNEGNSNPVLNEGTGKTSALLNEGTGKTTSVSKEETEKINCNARAKIDDCPHKEIIDLYHEILPVSPRVVVWNEKRAALLRQRWREDKERQSLDWWRGFFEKVSSSDFLCGRVDTGNGHTFIADLEWLIRPTNIIKVIEGRYENRKSSGWRSPIHSGRIPDDYYAEDLKIDRF